MKRLNSNNNEIDIGLASLKATLEFFSIHSNQVHHNWQIIPAQNLRVYIIQIRFKQIPERRHVSVYLSA